jgi:outer membrane protein OmpA-like peptidoglycan-associated protein
MNTNAKNISILAAAVSLALMSLQPAVTFAQGVERSEAIASSDVLSQISMFSYKEGPKSQLLFRGTPVAATAEGKAQVEYQNGNAQISAKIDDLPKPASLGPYTTYVLWAITPDGRASNKGVIGNAEGGKGEMDTQDGASQFALVVTAEPHFAVSVPSTMIVLYNVADDVKGSESKVTTLTERADYSSLSAIAIDDEANSVEMVQARYSLAVARAAGADRYATAEFSVANEKLSAAERAMKGKNAERKTAPGLAREAVVAGEDARRAGMLASAAAAVEAKRVAAAAASDQAAKVAAAKSDDAARQATAMSNAAAQLASAQSAEAARVAAAASSEAASAAARVAAAETAAAQEAERQAAATAARDDLRNRLNAALPTRESNRGLVSEIGGVQFATGNATLNESARENLSRFSGIVASYPTMRFNIEGHTDSTGSVETNNSLSLQRATSVRDYLIGRGVSPASIEVAGMGSSMPTNDNATLDGRARNRRVEIVLSGGPLTAAAR